MAAALLEFRTDQFGAVAAHKDYLEIGLLHQEAAGELPARDVFWHDDVCEEQMHASLFTLPNIERFGAVGSDKDGVTHRFKHTFDELPEHLFVFDHENGGGPCCAAFDDWYGSRNGAGRDV